VFFCRIVREALEQTAERIRSGNVMVLFGQDMPKVRADMPRIVKLLVNLIEDSVKYMGNPEGPKIEISSRKNREEVAFFTLPLA
jgi:light-regulated signal transduction histidine kinase (bacteriophytochrome)